MRCRACSTIIRTRRERYTRLCDACMSAPWYPAALAGRKRSALRGPVCAVSDSEVASYEATPASANAKAR